MPTPLNQRHNANAIRILAMDAVQKANSGHPGAPMGMADIAEVVWREFLNHNPKKSQMGKPRPFCVIKWTRLHAPLCLATFVRL